MRNTEFKVLENKLWASDENDRIWWDGYIFMDLTRKQSNAVYHTLKAKGFPIEDGAVIMPSGISIREAR